MKTISYSKKMQVFKVVAVLVMLYITWVELFSGPSEPPAPEDNGLDLLLAEKAKAVQEKRAAVLKYDALVESTTADTAQLKGKIAKLEQQSMDTAKLQGKIAELEKEIAVLEGKNDKLVAELESDHKNAEHFKWQANDYAGKMKGFEEQKGLILKSISKVLDEHSQIPAEKENTEPSSSRTKSKDKLTGSQQ